MTSTFCTRKDADVQLRIVMTKEVISTFDEKNFVAVQSGRGLGHGCLTRKCSWSRVPRVGRISEHAATLNSWLMELAISGRKGNYLQEAHLPFLGPQARACTQECLLCIKTCSSAHSFIRSLVRGLHHTDYSPAYPHARNA